MLVLVPNKDASRFAGNGTVIGRGHGLAQNQRSHAVAIAVEQKDHVGKQQRGDDKKAPDICLSDCRPGPHQRFEIRVRDRGNDDEHQARGYVPQRQRVGESCCEIGSNFNRESDKNEQQQDIYQDHCAGRNCQLSFDDPTCILKHREPLHNQPDQRQTRDADAKVRGSASKLAVRFGPDSH